MMKYSLVIRQLTRPFSYLLVKHPDKWVYDWLAPLILAALMLLFCTSFIPYWEVFSEDGLIDKLNSIVATLPGFFIAALAAVATFGRNDIDDIMDEPPTIEVLKGTDLVEVEMTRRRYLSVLFAYLTGISLILSILGYFATSSDAISDSDSIVIFTSSFIYFFILSQMTVATFQGLYYLGERLHTPQ